MNSFLNTIIQSAKFLTPINNHNLVCLRNASKKASSSTQNTNTKVRPKHRGWRVQDGTTVKQGTLLVKQRLTRFHPGLNVGFGCDGTLFAMEPGKVMVTCEKINPNFNNRFIRYNYKGRQGQVIYKKHFNVIPAPQSDRFVVIDRI